MEEYPKSRLEDVLGFNGKDGEDGKDYLARSVGKPWQDYQAVAKSWLLDAASAINRKYEKDERVSFAQVKSANTNEPRSPDRVFDDVYTKLKPHPNSVYEESLAKILRDFGLNDSDASPLLTQMYVTHAKSSLLKSNLREAATYYDSAAAMDSNSSFDIKATALRFMEEGNVCATEGSDGDKEKAIENYRAAIDKDQSLRRLIGDPVEAAAKTDFTPEVKAILGSQPTGYSSGKKWRGFTGFTNV